MAHDALHGEIKSWFVLYYKSDRYSRREGQLDDLVADRVECFNREGFACIASYHDSNTGHGVYFRNIAPPYANGIQIHTAP